MKDIRKVTILGSGRIATQLALAFNDLGIDIIQVWSRTLKNAQSLAEQVNSEAINDSNLLRESDLFIVAISDDAISDFVSSLPVDIPVVHTSGNTSMITRKENALSGVFYPLQTFSKNNRADWSNLPICIEANTSEFKDKLFQLAKLVSSSVHEINSDQRKILHTSAVIACNFTTHLAAIAEQILVENNLKLDLIQPLIKQTFTNISKGDVKAKQTGPAVRQDHGTIDAHLDILSSHPDIQSLYLALSKHIISYHHGQ